MDKKFNHIEVEKGIYDFWLENKLFSSINKSKKNFSIIIPPPNVTGKLHIGHALDTSIQDTIIRYKKLSGYNALYIPGTDHAGISAQTKFQSVLKENGVDHVSMSNEVFLEKLNLWVLDQIKYIHQQWGVLGLALAYDVEAFTMDESANDLVLKTFVKLYNDKLIYQADKLVNWDIKLKTAISDIEVINKETPSKMYYFKYEIVDSKEYLIVATTRPETMFGDIGLFVNPNDKRYKKYIGKYAINPVNGEKLKIYSDEYIDITFGTGVMKCTPAHDFNDYELAKKHNIVEYYSVFNFDGTLNDKCGKFVGMDRLIARPKIVEWIKEKDLLIKIENHKSNIGYSERTNEVIEPLISKQWFVKMKPIIENMDKILKNQPVNFIPAKFKKENERWADNIQDWCISRQLLWGHRIPVWYSIKDNKKIIVSVNPPKNSKEYIRDEGVLDTWFSSGLWPLSTTKNNPKGKLNSFYPIDVLCTGRDILFFWVSRMLFQCTYYDSTIPFKNVLLHGLVRDSQGRKMSKSLGNGIDPIDLCNKYGADALRLYLVGNCSTAEDSNFNEEKLKFSYSFVNKIWNASNFLMQYNCNAKCTPTHILNIWILNEFNNFISSLTKKMDKYNFILSFQIMREFIWDVYCNKYLEYIKPYLNNKSQCEEFIYTAKLIFKNILICMHPFCCFMTEKIYTNMFNDFKSIMLEQYPNKIKVKKIDIEKVSLFESAFSYVHNMRIKHSIKWNENIKIYFNDIDGTIEELLKKYNIVIDESLKNNSNPTIFNGVSFYSNIKKSETSDNIAKRINELKNELERSKNILSNQNFLSKASIDKISEEKNKQKKYQEEYDKLIDLV